MLSEYQAALFRRRFSPATVRLRTFWIVKFSAAYDPTRATLEDMEEFIDSNPRWSDNTRQSIVASLRSYFSWAHRAGLVDRNHALDLQRVRVRRRHARLAADAVILAALETADHPQAAMIRLGAECGLRVSEIAALHKSSRDGEWLYIIGKGGQERLVHMRDELIAALDMIEATTMRRGFYFPGRHGSLHPTTIWRHIRGAVGVNPHALRHRAGTTVYYGTGKDMRVAQEFLGHASLNTTQVYVHVERDALMRASAATRLVHPGRSIDSLPLAA